MQYCSHCGAEINDEAFICPRCGCAVTRKTFTSNSSNTTNKYVTQDEKSLTKRTDWIPLVFGIISSIQIFIRVIYFLLGYGAFIGAISRIFDAYNSAVYSCLAIITAIPQLKTEKNMPKAGIIIGGITLFLRVIFNVIWGNIL